MGRTLIHEEQKTLPFPVDQVWAILSGFGAIKTWIPTIDACITNGSQVGAVRTVYYSGTSIQEKLRILDWENHTISYEMLEPTGLPMKGGHGTVSLAAAGVGANETRVTWTSDAEEVDDQGKQVIASIFGPFIRGCIRGLEEALSRPTVPMVDPDPDPS
ncbi:hypothetical protein CLAIMM_02008 [Cladophialophora immunda]|nr:hypothetical protein CLAIMM_02008 [Cladophialophora immunda]